MNHSAELLIVPPTINYRQSHFFHLPSAVLEEAGAAALREVVESRQCRQTIISLTEQKQTGARLEGRGLLTGLGMPIISWSSWEDGVSLFCLTN